jgi:histidinol-phosphate phosphatase family protein
MTMKPRVVILAGGFGTRLNAIGTGIPKPLTIVDRNTILEHQIIECQKYGFLNISILLHHEAEAIKKFIGDGTKYNVNISYCVEEVARGTAGAIWDCIDNLNSNFIVLYADIYIDVDLSNFYKKSQVKKAAVSLFVHPNDHPFDSDLVVLNSDGYLQELRPSPRDPHEIYSNLVSSGLAVVNKKIFNKYRIKFGKYDLMSDVVPRMLADGQKVYGYISSEYAKDMGTPSRLKQVKNDIKNGLPKKLSRSEKRSAVFLDRDGTINEDVPLLRDINDFKLISGAANAIKLLNQNGYLTLCVTNQPVLARGDLSFSKLFEIHQKLDKLLGDYGAYINGIYVCPHHPDKGFKNEVSELKINCMCRKPGVGLLRKGLKDFNVDPKKSWLIGDRTTDIMAGDKCGLKTILVLTGNAGLDKKCNISPDYIFTNISEASEWIVAGHKNISLQLQHLTEIAIKNKFALIGGYARSGKSTCAQVMKELISATGRKAHIISADSWLKPVKERHESNGVLSRYHNQKFIQEMLRLINADKGIKLHLPSYEKLKKEFIGFNLLKIDPKDFLIIEGIPALMNEELIKETEIRIWVDAEETVRAKRMEKILEVRGLDERKIRETIASRNIDEVPKIEKFQHFATYTVRIKDDS